MPRLNVERQKELEPKRFSAALKALSDLGYELYPNEAEGKIEFLHNHLLVTYWPYSGWASGKSIKDGRGLKNLLNQLNK